MSAGTLDGGSDEKIPLPEGRYCWHISTSTEYRGMERILHETGENLVGGVTLPFATALFLVAAPFVLVIGGVAFLLH